MPTTNDIHLCDQTATALADLLIARGYPVIDVEVGDDAADGAVYLSSRVHIQVPSFGGAPGVVEITASDTFVFHPTRTSLEALCADLACVGVTAETSGERH